MAKAWDFSDAANDVGDEAVRAAIESALGDGNARQRLGTPYVWRNPATIQPRDWLVGREVLRGELHGLIAPGAAGKTIFSVGRALSVVTGRDLLGKRVWNGPGRAWIWNLEDPMEELDRIIAAACKHWNITKADIGDRLIVDSAVDGNPLKFARSGVSEGLVLNRPLIDELTAELTEYRIDYLHVDPFVSSHSAQESDNMEMDAIAKEWVQVAARSKTAICLAHHTSKAGAVDVTALSGRGAVAVINACRSVLTVNRMSEEEAKRYGIEDERRRRYFRTYDDKGNRAPPADDSDWYQLGSVDLGNGTSDRPSDSVGVVMPWDPPDPFAGVTTDHLHRVQCAIDAGEFKAHYSAKDWAGYAVAAVLGIDADDKGHRIRIIQLLKTWTANGALKEEERKDKNRQQKKYLVVGRWSDDLPATPRTGVAPQGVAVLQPSATLHPAIKDSGCSVAANGDTRPDAAQKEKWHPNPALGKTRSPAPRHPDDDDDPAADALIGRETRY